VPDVVRGGSFVPQARIVRATAPKNHCVERAERNMEGALFSEEARSRV
jgi:hypothetical protein